MSRGRPEGVVEQPVEQGPHTRTLLVAFGVLIAAAMVWRTSAATSNGSTDNSGNSWSAGTVSLSDDDSTTAMFAASGLAPGSTGSRCIEVTYGGSLAAVVKLYATAASEAQNT